MTMKKIIYRTLFSGHLFAFFLITLTQACAQNKTQVPKTIPEFTFYTLEKDTPFTRNNLAVNNKNIAILFFDPGCSHCQKEIQAIGQRYNSVKDVNLYLVAMQEKSLINAFMASYGKALNGKRNVTLLQDKNYEFIGKFKPTQYPATFVYGPDKQLKAFWDGDKAIQDIIKALNM